MTSKKYAVTPEQLAELQEINETLGYISPLSLRGPPLQHRRDEIMHDIHQHEVT
jgi:hypothetical protein